jgi:hypothetical protein
MAGNGPWGVFADALQRRHAAPSDDPALRGPLRSGNRENSPFTAAVQPPARRSLAAGVRWIRGTKGKRLGHP